MNFIDYILLFFTALGAATFLPIASEVLIIYYIEQSYNQALLLLFASTGNTLGSYINFLLGKYASIWAIRKNYMSEKYINKSTKYVEKYGGYALLLSWMPIIGDPITFAAGVLRYHVYKFIVIVFIAKLARYAFLIFLFNSV